ncbi:GntR family transcriptional regulator [Kocuria tytonis]|uniref:GntR family transcriptional regulator n=1 Tax=Kocuria tytonis TaxID=2054280 RepID=A0A495A2Y2_9MICC|nr:GntR family transcriptional regulator [Kocuria tytonis]RKQ33733.1 GntR family transcriptional regulator [Kocuria tytonis]
MFTVDPHSTTPVYEQLVECVLRDVAGGELVVGDRIPPVRTLAGELGLAAGTVAKAYKEMEARGVIETRGRAGTFIAQSRDDRETAAARAAARYLDEVAGQLHYSPQQCVALVERAVRKRAGD